MKPITMANLSEAVRSPTFVKITAFALLSLSLFFLFGRFSAGNPSLIFSSLPPLTRTTPSPLPPPSNPPPLPLATETSLSPSPPPLPPPSPPQYPPPPPVDILIRMGIVDETGAMTLDFEVGEIDESITDDELKRWASGTEEEKKEEKVGRGGSVKVEKYEVCDQSMRDYVPCLDNVDEIRRLNLGDSVEKYERHCPEEGKGLDCVVPRPERYQVRIPWPRSRDEVV